VTKEAEVVQWDLKWTQGLQRWGLQGMQRVEILSTVQYSAVPYSAVQYSPVRDRTVQAPNVEPSAEVVFTVIA